MLLRSASSHAPHSASERRYLPRAAVRQGALSHRGWAMSPPPRPHGPPKSRRSPGRSISGVRRAAPRTRARKSTVGRARSATPSVSSSPWESLPLTTTKSRVQRRGLSPRPARGTSPLWFRISPYCDGNPAPYSEGDARRRAVSRPRVGDDGGDDGDARRGERPRRSMASAGQTAEGDLPLGRVVSL